MDAHAQRRTTDRKKGLWQENNHPEIDLHRQRPPSLPVFPANELIGRFEIGDLHILRIPLQGDISSAEFVSFHIAIYRIVLLYFFLDVKTPEQEVTQQYGFR